jgi:hypothetical protein
MTPTQIARRSDALYADGTCGMTRRVLCDMVAQREADLEDAKAESAKLRTFIDLKETCWKRVGWCDECPYNGVDDEHDDCNCTVQENINLLARELGIEVDE